LGLVLSVEGFAFGGRDVGGTLVAVVPLDGADLLAAAGAFEPEPTHQLLDRAAGRGDAFAVQLPPDLAGSVDAVVVGVDAWMRCLGSASRRLRALGGRLLAA
jgi:hypothetical protein